MEVSLDQVGKRYSNREWIFKNLSQTIQTGDHIAITGNNGSGKSTLLKMIGGIIQPSSGQINYRLGDQSVDPTILYQHISFTSPYLELVEDFTLIEFLRFHFNFKNQKNFNFLDELINLMFLNGHENKLIKNFSSGMKQRVKLGITFFSSSYLILLDEPTTNLDEKGILWYKTQIDNLKNTQTILVASNQKHEYDFCHKIIDMNTALDS